MESSEVFCVAILLDGILLVLSLKLTSGAFDPGCWNRMECPLGSVGIALIC